MHDLMWLPLEFDSAGGSEKIKNQDEKMSKNLWKTLHFEHAHKLTSFLKTDQKHYKNSSYNKRKIRKWKASWNTLSAETFAIFAVFGLYRESLCF